MKVNHAVGRLAAGAALVALTVGACGGTGTKTTSTPKASQPVTAAATNGLEKMSADQVSRAALAALEAAPSVRVTGSQLMAGRSERYDLRFQGKAHSGTYTLRGAEIQTIVTADGEYLKAGADGWAAMGNAPGDAGMIAGRWVRVPSMPASMMEAFSLPALTSQLAVRAYTPGATVAQATLSGQQVVVVTYADGSKLYVANLGMAYPVRFVAGGSADQMNFTEYGTKFHITTPKDVLG